MSFLDEYLQKKRDAKEASKYEVDDTPQELLQSFTSNLGILIASTANTVKEFRRNAVGSSGSAALKDAGFENIARKAGKDEVAAIGVFASTLDNRAKITNERLLEAVKQLRGVGDTLRDMFHDTIAQRQKDDAYSKRVTGPSSGQGGRETWTGRPGQQSNRSLFDFFDRRNSGAGRERSPTVGSPKGSDTGKGGWWDRVKEKVGMGGEKGNPAEGKGGRLFQKLGGLKGGAAVGALMAIPALYEAFTGGGDTVKDVSKVAGSTAGGAGGWLAGAAAGGALGAAGGPLAPITVPAGALMGGLAGAWAGSELGEAVAGSMVDVTRSLGDIPDRISKSFTNDIVPGFDRATSFMSETAGKLGDTVLTAFTGLSRHLNVLGDELKEGAGTAAKFVASAPGRVAEAATAAVRTGGQAATSAVKTLDQKTGGLVRKGLDLVMGENKGIGKVRATGEEMAAIQKGRDGGEKFRLGSGLNQKTADMIDATSEKHGVDKDYMKTMAMIESGGNANAVSATGAVGLYQFTGGTANQYKLGNRFDAEANTDAAARLAKNNQKYLEGKGIKATPDMLYLAHQMGAGGVENLVSASQGKGRLSDETIKNMGHNYGVMSAQEYLDKNKKVWSSKSEQAKTRTERQYADLSKGERKTVDQAGAEKDKSRTSEGKIAGTDQDTNVGWGVEARLAKAKTPVVDVVQRRAPVEKVSAAEPPEAKTVLVANAAEMRPDVAEQKVQQPTLVANQGNTGQLPTLENMPLMINDLGLMLLNIGHV